MTAGTATSFAAERLFAELAVPEPSSRTSRTFGYDDLARFGELFETGGDVDRVAGHHRITRLRDRGGEDLARIHSGADLESYAEACLETCVHLVQASPHPEGRA